MNELLVKWRKTASSLLQKAEQAFFENEEEKLHYFMACHKQWKIAIEDLEKLHESTIIKA